MLLNKNTHHERMIIPSEGIPTKEAIKNYLKQKDLHPTKIMVSYDLWTARFKSLFRSATLMGIPVCTQSGLDINELILMY